MRIQLSLQPKRPFSLSLNYQQYLSAVIYNLISQASSEHGSWLHDRGFVLGGKHFKHFTFSRLMFPERPLIRDGRIFIDAPFSWLVSIHTEATLLQLIIGLFERRSVTIGQANNEARIRGIEILPEPVISDKMKFICLSPVLVKKPVNVSRNGNEKLSAEYLMPGHPEAGFYLSKNLVSKYLSLHPEIKETDKSVRFMPDEEYIRRKEGRISKLIAFKNGSDEEIRLRAFECPFTLEGEKELIRIAYECGLGDNNAMGFGMIETVNNGSRA